jgi:DNA-binding transcriptional regulator YdaS (Cro superfamily)
MTKFDKFLDQYGASRLAAELGVSQGAVSHWRRGRFRIPAERCRDIVARSEGALSVQDLRPDVFGEPAKAA